MVLLTDQVLLYLFRVIKFRNIWISLILLGNRINFIFIRIRKLYLKIKDWNGRLIKLIILLIKLFLKQKIKWHKLVTFL